MEIGSAIAGLQLKYALSAKGKLASPIPDSGDAKHAILSRKPDKMD